MRLAGVPLLCAALFVCGCSSLPNPLDPFTPDFTALPADELRRVAAAIEQSVQKGDPDAVLQSTDRVSLESPLIQQALRTRTLRNERVAALLQSGHAYELRNGLVKLHSTKEYRQSTTSQQQKQDASIVVGENESRWMLYENLLKINGWPSRSLSEVRSIFFEARLEAMRRGEHYETESGEVVPKAG